MSEELKKFYFTFGLGSEHKNDVQIIYAPDMKAARARMFEEYNSDWAFGYTADEWAKTETYYNKINYLEPLFAVL